MARYHCDRVSDQLQSIPDIRVKAISDSSWTFAYKSAKANVRVLPGCCGILLFYQVSGTDRDLGRMLAHTTRAASKANFGMVLMSLRSDAAFRKTLKAEQWHSVAFTNPRTRNQVELLSYVLPVKIKAAAPSKYGQEDA